MDFRFNFFCDEMILIRNEWIVSNLDKKGKQPFIQNMERLKEKWLATYPSASEKTKYM